MTTRELTVTRWHKVCERLSQRATEQGSAALEALGETRVDGYSGKESVEAMELAAKKAEESLSGISVLLDSWAEIRARLAAANAANGVSVLMARQERAQRELKVLTAILTAQKPNMVAAGALAEYKPFVEKNERFSYRGDEPKGAISVRTLSKDGEAKIRARVEELRLTVSSMADKASDINREKVSIDVPDEVARVCGID